MVNLAAIKHDQGTDGALGSRRVSVARRAVRLPGYAVARRLGHRRRRFRAAGIGVSFYGYRHVSPSMGRWLSRDPMEERGGPNFYLFCVNAPIDILDYLGLASCSAPKITSFNFGGSGRVPLIGLGYAVRAWGSLEDTKCSKCCPDGRSVVDERTTVAINGKAGLVGQSGGGSFSVGPDIRISYWYGIRAEVGLEGSVSGTLESDRCNGIEKQGSVCFKAGGYGALSVGGRGTLRFYHWLQDAGLYGTGSGRLTAEKCYNCVNGSCSWGPTKVCLSGQITATVNFIIAGYTWQLWNGSTCFEAP